MGNRIAPAGGTRISFALLAFALVAGLVGVVAWAPPAQAQPGEYGPARSPEPAPPSSTAASGRPRTSIASGGIASASRWDAILPTTSGWRIASGAIPQSAGAAPVYGPVVGLSTSEDDRPDIYWDESIDRLYVLMSGQANTQLFTIDYNAGADVYGPATGPHQPQ